MLCELFQSSERRRRLPPKRGSQPLILAYLSQVEEPFVIGQSFFGAVMSEQAVTTIEAMMAVATSRRRRIMGVS